MAMRPQDVMNVDNLLQKKEEEYHGTDFHLGLTLLTFPQYISATRSTMWTNHLKQFTTLNSGEFPRVFTGYENMFGRASSAFITAKNNYEVIAKIEKYADNPGYLYALFFYDTDNKKYRVLFKRTSEVLTEKFGFLYNNEDLDKLKVGDTVAKGDVLYKSSSFDKENNYCYGRNPLCAYILEAGNIEDAYVVSKDFADSMLSHKISNVKISINDNDFLLNLYGDGEHYKVLPDIGEFVDRQVVAAKRRIVNDEILYSMKKSNMRRINSLSDKIYYSKGYVTDIEIYSNKEIDEIPVTEYNEQLIYYLKNQTRYYQEILGECQKIIDTGEDYDDDIGFIYNRAKQILDPSYKWRDNENVFSNIIVEVRVERDDKLLDGSKITGRFGDKGVIRVRANEEMPFMEDGRRIDVVASPLSCINRLNTFLYIEVSLNHMANQLCEQLKKFTSLSDKHKHLMRFMSYFNERNEATELDKAYKNMTRKEKEEFFARLENEHSLYINYPPMWESMPAIDKIEQLYDEFGFTRDQLYLKKWGRVIPLMHKVVVGEKFVIKLKQTSDKNFSARSTGYLSQRGLPEKSNKVKTNELLFSTTPITIGRDENNNIGIGVSPFMLAKFHLVYRTSPFARKQVGKLYTNDVLGFKKFKIKKGYKNRNVEILNAKLKSLGAKIDFGFNGLRFALNDESVKSYSYKGKLYICTETEMREFLLEELLRKNFNKKKLKGTKKELEKKYQRYKRSEISKAQGMLVFDLGDE